MEVYMVNLKVNCCMCMEILSRVPRQAVSMPCPFKMQCYSINAVYMYHNVLCHVTGNDASLPLHFQCFSIG
jgi:hypothetical protein